MYGQNKENNKLKELENGFGMYKMSRMIRVNTSMYIKMFNLTRVTMDLIFGR